MKPMRVLLAIRPGRLQLEVDENQTLMVLGFSADAMQSMINDAEVDGCQWRLKQMRMTMNIWHCIVNALQDDAPCFDELLVVDVVEHREKTDGVCLVGQIPRGVGFQNRCLLHVLDEGDEVVVSHCCCDVHSFCQDDGEVVVDSPDALRWRSVIR